MKAYSVDLRTRVVAAVEGGMALTAAATTFQVSTGSIKRWCKRQRDGHPLEPHKPAGRPRKMTAAHDDCVRRLVEATPDATLAEYTQQWNDQHPHPISQWTFGRAVRRLGLTRKKRP